MQRFSLPNITDIKIPRSHLQNPNNEEALQQLLGTEASLTWIGNTIDSIKQQRPFHFIITVDDSSPLNTIEETMLGAIQNYIDDHVGIQARRYFSSAAATAAAAANTAVSDNTTYTPAATLAADAAASASPLALVTDAATQNDAAVLSVITKILNLEIWKNKGWSILWYKCPTGIDAMQKLESPTITSLADTARTQLTENKITRTGMTGRFYNMIVDLAEPSMTPATREERLIKYATDEIVINADIVNSWTVGKVVLSDKDRATLCDISGIDNTPEAIATLVKSAADPKAIADADAALQTTPRP